MILFLMCTFSTLHSFLFISYISLYIYFMWFCYNFSCNFILFGVLDATMNNDKIECRSLNNCLAGIFVVQYQLMVQFVLILYRKVQKLETPLLIWEWYHGLLFKHLVAFSVRQQRHFTQGNMKISASFPPLYNIMYLLILL